MSHKNNRNNTKDARNRVVTNGIEDILGLTDTEDSSSSSNTQLFEHDDPFILELHELKRDNELPDNSLPEVKAKKRLKKKKKGQQPTAQSTAPGSSTSPSEESVAPVPPEELPREEFYDAHESYHALPENQASAAVASAAIAQVHSEHSGQPKVMSPVEEQTEPAQNVTREPSTAVTKPVTPSQPE